MKILFLGGTTFFGLEAVKALVKSGHEVTVFTRGKRKAPEGVQFIRGDRANYKMPKGPWDVVIDNIAYEGEWVRDTLKRVSCGRYILTSTISVYRYRTSGFYGAPLVESTVDHGFRPKEEDLTNLHWAYARGKLEAERQLLEARSDGIIFRPTVVYGPWDPKLRGFWYLQRILDGGPILIPNDGQEPMQLIFSKDIAKIFTQAVEKNVCGIFNVAQNESITLKEFINVSMKALHQEIKCISVPKEKITFEMPLDGLATLIIDCSRLLNAFNPEFIPLHRWISDTAVWFRDYWTGDRGELLMDRESEFTLLRALSFA